MVKPRFPWLILAILALAILGSGYQAWRASQQATVIVEWTTASEVDTAGFNLYRSDTAQGTYVRVNANLVPASPDPLTGGSYQYKDSRVQPGKTYYYQLEDVQLDGQTTRHGPIEVQANNNGFVEWVVMTILFLVGLFVAFWFFTRTPARTIEA
jgi:hypothetical protein